MTQIQPLKVDQLPTPLPPAETVAEQVKVANPPPLESPSGTHEQWMAAAGIQPGDFANVDNIIRLESGWRPDAINPSSGSCGLSQALPCEKIPGDWKNPVDALRWGDSYVKGRYGSWSNAVAWWKVHGWY